MIHITLKINEPYLPENFTYISTKVQFLRDLTRNIVEYEETFQGFYKEFDYDLQPNESIFLRTLIRYKREDNTLVEYEVATDHITYDSIDRDTFSIIAGSNIQLEDTNYYSLDIKSIKVKIDPPVAYRGSIEHIATKYAFYDLYYNHIFTHIGRGDELLEATFNLHRFKSLSAVILEVSYIGRKEHLQAKDRRVILLDNSHIAAFTISKRFLERNSENLFIVKSIYKSLINAKYTLFNRDSGHIITSGVILKDEFIIDTNLGNYDYNYLTLAVYGEDTTYGSTYTEFKLKVV